MKGKKNYYKLDEIGFVGTQEKENWRVHPESKRQTQ